MVIALSLDVGAPLLASTWSNSWMTLTVAERLPSVLCCCIGFDPAPTSAENNNLQKFLACATGQSCPIQLNVSPSWLCRSNIFDIWMNPLFFHPGGFSTLSPGVFSKFIALNGIPPRRASHPKSRLFLRLDDQHHACHIRQPGYIQLSESSEFIYISVIITWHVANATTQDWQDKIYLNLKHIHSPRSLTELSICTTANKHQRHNAAQTH